MVTLTDGRKALVLQAMGRLYMDALDCPFRATQQELARQRLGVTVQASVIDFHAEASSEKMAFAHSFDGQASLIVGTHTHCPRRTARCCRGARRFSPSGDVR